jgi:hypothetical protein
VNIPVVLGKEYRLHSSSVYAFLAFYPSSILFSSTPSETPLVHVISCNVKRPSFTPYRTTGKIRLVMYNFNVFRQQLRRQNVLDAVVASITQIHLLLISSLIKFVLVAVVPKYMKCTTFLKNLVAVFMTFALHSCDRDNNIDLVFSVIISY